MALSIRLAAVAHTQLMPLGLRGRQLCFLFFQKAVASHISTMNLDMFLVPALHACN